MPLYQSLTHIATASIPTVSCLSIFKCHKQLCTNTIDSLPEPVPSCLIRKIKHTAKGTDGINCSPYLCSSDMTLNQTNGFISGFQIDSASLYLSLIHVRFLLLFSQDILSLSAFFQPVFLYGFTGFQAFSSCFLTLSTACTTTFVSLSLAGIPIPFLVTLASYVFALTISPDYRSFPSWIQTASS